MIKEYDGLVMYPQDMYYFADKGDSHTFVFREADVNRDFHNLLGASPFMYGTLDGIVNSCEQMLTNLENTLKYLPEPFKTHNEAQVSFLRLLKINALRAMRIAEVGGRQAMREETSQQNI